MDEEAAPTATDGIYTTCELCFAIVAHETAHKAWHESRGEVSDDAHD